MADYTITTACKGPRVAIVITARPSYAKLKTVIAALVERGADVHIIACASALLERYGNVKAIIEKDFPATPIIEAWSTYEGANLITSAKETGGLLTELSSVLYRLSPGVVCVCADRHEVLAAAQAGAYLHLPVVHLQGGERTGSIDDRCRDSITALADIHCVSTRRAQMRVYGLTGSHQVYWTGCPSIDLAKQALNDPPVTWDELGGTGPRFDLRFPFLMVLQHPVTSEADQAGEQMHATLEACANVNLPRLLFWSGEDAGTDAMSAAVRQWRHVSPERTFYTLKNLPPARFLRVLSQASVLVGNSSAGIREASYLGVPVVNIGTRQQGRERAKNVRDVPHDSEAIWAATCEQVQHGPYSSSDLYGSGNAGEKIAEVICGRVDSRACRSGDGCVASFRQGA